MTLYFSRMSLDRTAGNAAVASLLDPDDPSLALDAHHKVLWAAFDNGDGERDFLYRSDGRGRFYVLSKRPPAAHPLFNPPETKEYAPQLRRGDRLAFSLRANATKAKDREETSVRANGKVRRKGTRVDVVMDRLHSIPKAERAERRMEVAHEAAVEWMERQGQMYGFRIENPDDDFQVESYTSLVMQRRKGTDHRLGVLDLTGVLRVTDPDQFTGRLAEGFGRAKAFGCGLMLLRRA